MPRKKPLKRRADHTDLSDVQWRLIEAMISEPGGRPRKAATRDPWQGCANEDPAASVLGLRNSSSTFESLTCQIAFVAALVLLAPRFCSRVLQNMDETTVLNTVLT